MQTEKQQSFIRCKLSGLPLAKIDSLPWQAIPQSIAFSSFDEKQRKKIFNAAMADGSSAETKHFCLFTLLHNSPVDFTNLNARSVQHFVDWNDERMGRIFTYGLRRLFHFTSFYSNLPERQKAKFPVWRIAGGFSESWAESEEDKKDRHIFKPFFAVLNLWEQKVDELRWKGAKESGYKLEADNAEAQFMITADGENTRLEIEESIYKKVRAMQKDTCIAIFDSRSVLYKKQSLEERKKELQYHDRNGVIVPQSINRSDAIKLLKVFYKLSDHEYKEFLFIVHAAKNCSIERLTRFRNFAVERATKFSSEHDEENLAPFEHTAFIAYIRFIIAAKLKIEQTLATIQHEASENPIYRKFEAAEEAERQKNIAAGMPDRNAFTSQFAYLQAVMNWKKQQGSK